MQATVLARQDAIGGHLTTHAALPKAPVFGWDNLWPRASGGWPCVADLPACEYTTSGRAALYVALLQMRLPAGTPVLVPTYHCPTMVAPIIEAGHQPIFYPLASDGLPNMEWIAAEAGRTKPGAMFLPHYFGLCRSLQSALDWCRRHEVVLVEDCAHTYFGMAGERPVGHWGDYATASLSKFFPVPEAGLLARASGPLQPMELAPFGFGSQLKAGWDVLDFGCRHGRLAGLSQLLMPLRWARERRREDPGPWLEQAASQPDSQASPDCDMARRSNQATAVARAMHRWLPAGRIVARRRANFAALAESLSAAAGARVMQPLLLPGWVPYAMPLWVDGAARADSVYADLRRQRMPVFRWDRLWPGTPSLEGDTGREWSRQLLQLLCHQDLSEADIQRFATCVRDTLRQVPLS